MRHTVIVDYGAGNLRSAAKAFERMAGPSDHISVSAKVAEIASADRIVLPGVGAFADCYAGLHAIRDLPEILEESVIARARPFLGICVGMQLMATVGEEHGSHPGLGWIPGRVRDITPRDPTLKIPHMGWNSLDLYADHPVLSGISTGSYCYFVHSFHLCPDQPAHQLAVTDYGGTVSAMVGRDNIVGTQFHPEKSQAAGLRLIGNFLNWTP